MPEIIDPFFHDFFHECLISFYTILIEEIEKRVNDDDDKYSDNLLKEIIHEIFRKYIRISEENVKMTKEDFLKDSKNEKLLSIVKKEIILPIFRANFRGKPFQNISLNPNINKIIIDTAVDLFFERALYWCSQAGLTLKELFT